MWVGAPEFAAFPASRECRVDAPGWVSTVIACPEQADHIAGWILQPGLTPQPPLIGGGKKELEAQCLQLANFLVKLFDLEIADNAVVGRDRRRVMHRKCRLPDRTLEACVVGRADDLGESHGAEEANRFGNVACRQCYLVEVHDADAPRCSTHHSALGRPRIRAPPMTSPAAWPARLTPPMPQLVVAGTPRRFAAAWNCQCA
jgi:hypothetical protein